MISCQITLYFCFVIDNNNCPELHVVPASHTHTAMGIAAAIAIQARDFFLKKKLVFEGKENVQVINGNKEQMDKKSAEGGVTEEAEEQVVVAEKEIHVSTIEVTDIVVTACVEVKEQEVEVTEVKELDAKVTSVLFEKEKLTEGVEDQEDEKVVAEESLEDKANEALEQTENDVTEKTDEETEYDLAHLSFSFT